MKYIIEVQDENVRTPEGTDWYNVGEGPFDSAESATEFAEAEVGVKWRVKGVKSVSTVSPNEHYGPGDARTRGDGSRSLYSVVLQSFEDEARKINRWRDYRAFYDLKKAEAAARAMVKTADDHVVVYMTSRKMDVDDIVQMYRLSEDGKKVEKSRV